MDVSILEQVKIQAWVLVPLVQALEREPGTERAHEIVSGALGPLYRDAGERWWQEEGDGRLGDKLAAAFDGFGADAALTYTVTRQDDDGFDVDVTDCRYAQFYQRIGVPELGFLLTCGADFSMADGYGTDVVLTRSQTIMEGASHCDFRYRRRG